MHDHVVGQILGVPTKLIYICFVSNRLADDLHCTFIIAVSQWYPVGVMKLCPTIMDASIIVVL
jgi:hypothetical protein